jgi:predicted nucleic acid-binding protein
MAERTILVVDTSVVIKWFSAEDLTDVALQLRDAYVENEVDIYVPDLLLYELSNALRYNPEFDTEDVQAAVRSLLDMDFEIVTPTPHLTKTAIEIAHEHDLTVYDSTFVALLRRSKESRSPQMKNSPS